MADTAPRDPNRIPTLIAVSTVDYATLKLLTAIPFSATNTNALTVALVNSLGSQVSLGVPAGFTSTGGTVASSGNNTLLLAGTNRLKVSAFSLSTTSTTAVTCIFQSGAGGAELWRAIVQASPGTSTGANLAVSPPGLIFATASATLLNLNLSAAQTIHWSLSYFDEA